MSKDNYFASLILAAGEGTRMKSDLAKVLHEVSGKPMIRHVVETVKRIDPSRIVIIVGHQAVSVQEEFKGEDVEFVLQRERLGTGHAVMQARKLLDGFKGTVLILNGDTPLIRAETLRSFLEYHSDNAFSATVMSTHMKDPFGYGRIVRAPDGELKKIVEERDADDREKALKEINGGVFCVEGEILFKALDMVDRSNAQGEYYLTDIMHIISGMDMKTGVFLCENSKEVLGINTPSQLREAERLMSDG